MPPKPVLRINTSLSQLPPADPLATGPLRPRASTRGSPTEPISISSPIASPPIYTSSDSETDSETHYRGRTSRNNNARAGLHPRFVIDESPPSGSTSPEELEDPRNDTEPQRRLSTESRESLQEPRPPERVHTNLFGILASSATFNEMSLAGFGGHRDTLATLRLQRLKHSVDMSIAAFAVLASYLDFETYKAVRLVCRCWSTAFTYVRPPVFPPVYYLPVEVLKHIYGFLEPMDLNAARHTCRKWMIASLEYRFLEGMLVAGGFRASLEADAKMNEAMGHPFGGEWRLSKRLATECSLRRGWTGNGFDRRSIEPAETSTTEKLTNTSLTLSSVLDFTPLLKDQQSSYGDTGSTLQYAASVCSRFLLAFSGPIIHVFCIYDLNSGVPRYYHGGFMEFLASVECPGNVLAVSMDTSQNRYSIAALLDDRRGVIFDIPQLEAMAKRSNSSDPHSELGTPDTSNERDLNSPTTSTPTTNLPPETPPMFTDTYSTSPINDEPQPANNRLSPLPLRLIPHTLYRNLCSKTSPPLTVTIAPSRNCTAFGCSSGIELHWQDSRTGQEQSRWMDLLGPAELIYFLPPNRLPDAGE
ncbi:MAG: hypothetical protein Q9174_002443, partial [Haloplaca sp. 1 TL-2023]